MFVCVCVGMPANDCQCFPACSCVCFALLCLAGLRLTSLSSLCCALLFFSFFALPVSGTPQPLQIGQYSGFWTWKKAVVGGCWLLSCASCISECTLSTNPKRPLENSLEPIAHTPRLCRVVPGFAMPERNGQNSFSHRCGSLSHWLKSKNQDSGIHDQPDFEPKEKSVLTMAHVEGLGPHPK